jgi:hypothetical protein
MSRWLIIEEAPVSLVGRAPCRPELILLLIMKKKLLPPKKDGPVCHGMWTYLEVA